MAASANPILADKAMRDPTLFCTGYKRPRFYMFTRAEPGLVDPRNSERLSLVADFLITGRTSQETEMFSMSDPPVKNRA